MKYIFLFFTIMFCFDSVQKINAQTTTNYANSYIDLNLALRPFINIQPETGKIMKRKPNIIPSTFVFYTNEEISIPESRYIEVVSYIHVIVYTRGTSKTIVAEIPAFVDEYGQVRDLKNGSKLLSFRRTNSQLLRIMVLAPTHLPIVVNLDPQKDLFKDEIVRIDLTAPNSKVNGYLAKLTDGGINVPISATRPFSATSNIAVLIGGDATLSTDTFRFAPGLKFCVDGEDTQEILNRVGVETPNAILSGYFKEDSNFDGLVKFNGSNNDRVFGPLWALQINKYISICAIY